MANPLASALLLTRYLIALQRLRKAELTMSDQFPSLEGNEELEVEQRSADGSDGMLYKKTFNGQGDFSDPDSPAHEANKLATLQEALNRGLHPKDEPTLLSDELHSVNRRGVETRALTYGVEVEPAIIDENHPEGTVEPSDLLTEDQPASPKEASSAPRAKRSKSDDNRPSDEEA